MLFLCRNKWHKSEEVGWSRWARCWWMPPSSPCTSGLSQSMSTKSSSIYQHKKIWTDVFCNSRCSIWKSKKLCNQMSEYLAQKGEDGRWEKGRNERVSPKRYYCSVRWDEYLLNPLRPPPSLSSSWLPFSHLTPQHQHHHVNYHQGPRPPPCPRHPLLCRHCQHQGLRGGAMQESIHLSQL